MAGSKVNDILVFLSVVETGNFASAGKAFGLSRSTAGKAVARLEDRYGVRLLNRTTRAISLTEDGQKLYLQGQAIQAAIAAADTSMVGTDGIPSGTLRIAAPDALGRRLLMPLVQKFQKEWPDVRFEISFSDSVRRIVRDGFDLAVRVGITSPDTSLISRTLMTDRPVLCASSAYLKDWGTPKNIDQLSTHDLLQFSSFGQRQVWALQDGSGFWSNAPGRVRLRLDSAEGLREAAMSGMGIAFLPGVLVKDDLNAGRLVQVLPDLDCGKLPIVALYPHKRFLEPRVRHFIDLLAAELPGG
ncbi:LysR family transcriptional regulator [Leisingera sp. JC1]|uniref:LysR family transcriptional regulator n=1 Tax=Leisingera sp. JC1 TaxID=1855282 RepID=UPI0008029E49|nr:LysR family transcriptional regulator [Leisingera sp. JC1]OBY25295.1 LysR family transcriptional regulator [Leisingera sp. JC1]